MYPFVIRTWLPEEQLWKLYYLSHTHFVDTEGVCARFCSINKGCITLPPFCKKNLVARPFCKQNLVARPLCNQNLDIAIVNQNPLITKCFNRIKFRWVWVNTYRYIFSGMNIHLPAILGFTRYQGFDPSPDEPLRRFSCLFFSTLYYIFSYCWTDNKGHATYVFHAWPHCLISFRPLPFGLKFDMLNAFLSITECWISCFKSWVIKLQKGENVDIHHVCSIQWWHAKQTTLALLGTLQKSHMPAVQDSTQSWQWYKQLVLRIQSIPVHNSSELLRNSTEFSTFRYIQTTSRLHPCLAVAGMRSKSGTVELYISSGLAPGTWLWLVAACSSLYPSFEPRPRSLFT